VLSWTFVCDHLQVLDSDDMLESLCLNNNEYAWPLVNEFNTERDKERNPNLPTLRQAAADMILTYQRQIGDVGGALEELRKDLNAAQEIWELGLDTKRNRIIRLDLLFSMGTLSFSMYAFSPFVPSVSCLCI
jgi:magnesium transporter